MLAFLTTQAPVIAPRTTVPVMSDFELDLHDDASPAGDPPRPTEPENTHIARLLEEAARLLEEQGANRFRVHAYRAAAATLRQLDRPVSLILDAQGLEGLERLPTIGIMLARAIRDMLRTGRYPMLERLRGESDPVELLAGVPGIGVTLADRIHHDLGIDTLEELEAAAHDGRLATLPGFGAKRLAGVVDSLAARLERVRRRPDGTREDEPPIGEVLDVDREYRRKARVGALPHIAPRRFNPENKAWLPILHTQRGDRHYTALFSNTARAHRLGRTADWVVIYHDGDGPAQQCTVVTGRQGALQGRRVVRGRELECIGYYEERARLRSAAGGDGPSDD